MGVYAVSGVVMIISRHRFFEQKKQMHKKLSPALNADQLEGNCAHGI
jgi:hypothetical protein